MRAITARLWDSRDQGNCAEEEGSVETWENKVRTDTSGRRKDPQLSSFNPLPSSLFLCSSRPLFSLCDWSELQVWPKFWSQRITSHFVSQTCICWNWQPVCACNLFVNLQQRAHEGSRANESQNNGTIWFLGENGVRTGALTLTYLLHSPSFGTRDREDEIRSFTERSLLSRGSITRNCSSPCQKMPCLLQLRRF